MPQEMIGPLPCVPVACASRDIQRAAPGPCHPSGIFQIRCPNRQRGHCACTNIGDKRRNHGILLHQGRRIDPQISTVIGDNRLGMDLHHILGNETSGGKTALGPVPWVKRFGRVVPLPFLNHHTGFQVFHEQHIGHQAAIAAEGGVLRHVDAWLSHN